MSIRKRKPLRVRLQYSFPSPLSLFFSSTGEGGFPKSVTPERLYHPFVVTPEWFYQSMVFKTKRKRQKRDSPLVTPAIFKPGSTVLEHGFPIEDFGNDRERETLYVFPPR